jgi:hypothetical protein
VGEERSENPLIRLPPRQSPRSTASSVGERSLRRGRRAPPGTLLFALTDLLKYLPIAVLLGAILASAAKMSSR